MSATVIQMNEALADGEELLTFEQAGTLGANQTEVIRDGLNIANFAAPFIPSAKPAPPAPPAPAPNPPPVLAHLLNANQKANAVATFQKLDKLCDKHAIKPGQKSSMLSVALGELFVFLKPYIAALLASLLNPTPAPATKKINWK